MLNGCLRTVPQPILCFKDRGTPIQCNATAKNSVRLRNMMPMGEQLKDQDTLIEQSPCYELL